MSDAPDCRYDFIRHVNGYLHDTIKQTDLKAGASMALAVVMLCVSLACGSFQAFTKGAADQPEFYIGLLSYLLLLFAFGAGTFVIFPRIVHNPPKGWVFWESILGYTPEEFVGSLQAASADVISKALAMDSYIKARIVTQKLVWLRVSVYAGSVGIILAVATVFLMRK